MSLEEHYQGGESIAELFRKHLEEGRKQDLRWANWLEQRIVFWSQQYLYYFNKNKIMADICMDIIEWETKEIEDIRNGYKPNKQSSKDNKPLFKWCERGIASEGQSSATFPTNTTTL